MDLAKDILDIAEKVGQAPGLTVASSIVTSILKTVETSKNNTLRLRTLAHSLASQLIDISDGMKGKWDDAPLTLRRAVDEYDAFLLEILKSITRLAQSSRVRAFLFAGECEREITRLEKRVADVRSTIALMIGMNLSVAINQVQTSLAAYGHVGIEVHSGVQRLLDITRSLDLETESHQMMPDSSLFTREDFQVKKTILRKATYDLRFPDAMTVTFHQAERCSSGQAILIKTFEGNDPRRVRNQFIKEREMSRRSLNSALLQIIGWSRATAQIPFHVYHAPGGIIETFDSWVERTLYSNPVETIFGLYDMQNSIKELLELGRSQLVYFHYAFYDAVVNIQHHGDRPRFSLVYTGTIDKRSFLDQEYAWPDCRDYEILSKCPLRQSDHSIYDMQPAVTLMKLFAGGAKSWFRDVRGIEAMFKGNYDEIDPLQLGPTLLEAGWLSTSSMNLMPHGSMRLGDVGYYAQDGNFKVIANLHTRLISRSGGLPEWAYEEFPHAEKEPEGEYTMVTHAETLYRRYQHVITPTMYPFSRQNQHQVGYSKLDEKRALKTLQQEALGVIEDNHLSISQHALQLVTSVINPFACLVGQRDHLLLEMESTVQEEFPPDLPTITIYEFQREGSLSVLDSGVPELNAQVFYSFQENIDGLDITKMQQLPERGDILMRQDFVWPIRIEYLQLPLGLIHPSGIKETPD